MKRLRSLDHLEPGKTTLCSLLPRFYEQSSGSIQIDGIDTKDMTLSSLRKQIGIVQQDVFLFSGTIRENIAYGNLKASEAEIWQAVKRASIRRFNLLTTRRFRYCYR